MIYFIKSPKKEATWCSIITLANVDRFSKFGHRFVRKFSMYRGLHTKTSISPVICCYTTSSVADTGIGGPGGRPPPLAPPKFLWSQQTYKWWYNLMCCDHPVQTEDQHELHLRSNSDRLIHLRSLKSSSSHSKSPLRVRKRRESRNL